MAARPASIERRREPKSALPTAASEGRTTGNFNGRAIDSMTTETMVLKRVGSGWRIVQIHWSSAKVR